MRWRRITCWGLVAAAVGVVWAASLADTVRTKDGKTYAGTVNVLGDKVRVTQANGTTVVLDKKDVADIIASRTVLQEYADRESKVKANDGDGRFNLALWCDRNKLTTEAVRECAQALAIRPDHPGARQLMLHLLRPTGATPDDGSDTPSTTVTERNLLLEERPATQKYFRLRVQPVLNSKCASAQCHGGPRAGKLRLNRMRIGTTAGKDVYLPNFDAIYPFITDFYKPEKCLLLQHPLAVKEGGIPSKCKKVFRNTRDPQYRIIGDLIPTLLLPAPPESEEGGNEDDGGTGRRPG